MHLQIVGTDPKETYALLPADHPLAATRRFSGLKELPQFDLAQVEGSTSPPILLEGTTHHLYSEHAARAVETLKERARVIVLLRHPAKRVLSSFQYTKQNLARIPKTFTFTRYVDLLLSGQSDKIQEIIKHPTSSMVLSADHDYSDYSKHIQRWNAIVGDDKIRIVISEEYFRDPTTTLKSIYDWLRLPHSDIDPESLERKNQTRRIGSPGLHRMAYRLNQLVPNNRMLKPVKAIYFYTQKMRSGKRDEDVTKPLERLNEYFAPRVRELENLLGRDLSVWD